MLHFAICEDEAHFAADLLGMIEAYAQESAVEIRVSHFKNGLDLVDPYQTGYDLIFLDIQMDLMDGLQAAERIRELDPTVAIIFLTSLAQYALEGYKYQATNYILKPIKYARLKLELDQWRRTYNGQTQDFIVVKNDQGSYKIPHQTLKFIDTYDRKVKVHTETEEILSTKKLKDYESELPTSCFARCHNSFLVNLNFVKRVEQLEIQLLSGESLPISQPRRKQFMKSLTEYWGNQL